MALDKTIGEEKIFEVITKSQILNLPLEEAKSRPLTDLGIDSLDLISLSMLLEDDLNLKIDIENLMPFSTLEDLIRGLKPA